MFEFIRKKKGIEKRNTIQHTIFQDPKASPPKKYDIFRSNSFLGQFR